MACNLVYEGKKLVDVLDDLGNPSQLYKDAVAQFGEATAMEIYLASQSNEFKELLPSNTGKTQAFFSNVVDGIDDQFKAKKTWKPILPFTQAQKQFKKLYDKFKGNFDNHIATSIPTFRETQIKVGAALNNVLINTPKVANAKLAAIKDKYLKDNKLSNTTSTYSKLSPSLFKEIADYHKSATDDRNNPEMKESYRAFLDETKKQYEYLVKQGYKIEPWLQEGEPYGVDSDAVRKDITENKHLYYLRSKSATGDNNSKDTAENYAPFESTGVIINGDDVLFNDLFRAVHDIFGHGMVNNTFSAQGELNAYKTHSPMYSKKAQKALFLETVVYNAWYKENKNYAPRKIYSIPQRFLDEVNEKPLIYDIGGSEGGLVKAITETSAGNIASVNMDVNENMGKYHTATPVEGSEFVNDAFFQDYTDENGKTYLRHIPNQKADVVHESMVFQFMSPRREEFIREIKDNYIKEDGLLLLEEKLVPETDAQWLQNERVKDQYKLQFYTQTEISNKAESVLAGMRQNQTSEKELVRALKNNFTYVDEYWDAGNFKGYLATNSKDKRDNFMKELGGKVTSEFSSQPVYEEPKLNEVLKYITAQNENKEPLSKEQKIELHNFSIGVPNFSSQKLIETFFDENGMFSVDEQKLKESGLYNDYEISNLQNNTELQKTVKSAVEALKNTPELDLNTEEFPQKGIYSSVEETKKTFIDSENPKIEAEGTKRDVNALFDNIKNSKFSSIDATFDEIVKNWGKYKNLNNDNIRTIKNFIDNPTDTAITIDGNNIEDGNHRLIASKIKRDDFIYAVTKSKIVFGDMNLTPKEQHLPTQEVTNNITSFGKMTFLNPYVIEKNITETLGGTTEKEFEEKLSDLDYPNFQQTKNKEQLFQEMQNYVKADVLQVVDGEIREALNEDTAVIMPHVVKENQNPNLLESVGTFLAIDQDILDNNPEQSEILVKDIEDGLINIGVDAVGLSGKTNIKSFLTSLWGFLSSPTTESFNNFIKTYDELFEKDKTPQKTVIKTDKKDREYVKLNTNKTEEQLYNEQGLIKVEDKTYIRVNQKPLEELYSILQSYPEKFPDENIQEYVQKEVGKMEDIINPEVGEVIFLFKTYFDITKATKIARNGQPITVYRAQKDSREQGVERQSNQYGIYFSENKDSVKIYGDDIKEYTLNITNPIVLKDTEWNLSLMPKYVYDSLINQGYDGAVWNRKGEMYEIIAFYPSQIIKSDAVSEAVNDAVNFTGNELYLTTEYVSDFYIEGLKEKQKDSLKWKQFYSNFGINPQGLFIKNEDPLSMQIIEEYADENLRNYSLLSKQMPNLKQSEDIQQTTLQNRRDAAVNNPKSVEKFNGQLYQVTENEIVSKNGEKEFIRINGDVFEAIDTEGQLTLYAKLEKNNSQYNKFNTEQPQTNLNLIDYNYLETAPLKFVEPKNYVSVKKIIEENFDCA